MHVRCLGTAAGGGYPQWNCACDSCASARVCGRSARQVGFAVSGDRVHWWLLNVSVDVVQQLNYCPELAPGPGVRDTPVVGVLLTDAELDHVGGLLELRQTGQLTIAGATPVLDLVERDLHLGTTLEAYCSVRWVRLPEGKPVPLDDRLTVTAVPVGHKRPRYVRTAPREDQHAACVTALLLHDQRSCTDVLYAPTLPAWSRVFAAVAADADAVFVDGTFWHESEIAKTRAAVSGRRRANTMGHLPMTGTGGSLERLAQLKAPVKAYVHLNNTNPTWEAASVESRALAGNGVIVATEGMAWHF